jgi:hypothetical protein
LPFGNYLRAYNAAYCGPRGFRAGAGGSVMRNEYPAFIVNAQAFTMNALPLVRAPGIAAESPQDLHVQIRGLGAESPVFWGA